MNKKIMKSILDFNFEQRTVILRCDFNVTISGGKIIDNSKIKASLKTIEYILDHGAKLLIMSHLGRIKTKEDLAKNDMRIIYNELNKLLPNKVTFVDETNPKKLKKYIKNLEYGKAILMQNTRFEDLEGNKESDCNEKLSKGWASLGEFFINDAFATIHRKHASNYGISSYLPSGVGFLVLNEIQNLNILDNPERPFVVIMGGAKISSKIGIIEALIKHADYILIGGAMSYTFLKAKGYNMGKSLVEYDKIDYCKSLLERYADRIILPTDLYGVFNNDENADIILYDINKIPNSFQGMDIGDETVNKFISILKNTKTVFWNGPLGAYENKKFINGTEKVLKYLVDNVNTVILGGGDIVGCASILGYKDKVTYTSTGGGATLEYLENHNQPGLKNMDF